MGLFSYGYGSSSCMYKEGMDSLYFGVVGAVKSMIFVVGSKGSASALSSLVGRWLDWTKEVAFAFSSFPNGLNTGASAFKLHLTV